MVIYYVIDYVTDDKIVIFNDELHFQTIIHTCRRTRRYRWIRWIPLNDWLSSELSSSSQSLSSSAAMPKTMLMTPPILAFIDCNIASGQDEIASESLMTHVGRYRSAGVAPLFVTWLRERSDLRFVCMVRNLSEFNDFMLDVVRSVEGVRGTRTTLSFGGRADLDTLLELEMEVSANNRLVAASLWIDVQPGADRRCFQTLLDLPHHPDVRQVWLLNCYHSDDADLQMLLLGKNVAALTGYVMSWVRTTPGVIDTEISTVLDWRWLASPDDIVELCELFFTRTARERRQAAAKQNGEAGAAQNSTPTSTPTSGQVKVNS